MAPFSKQITVVYKKDTEGVFCSLFLDKPVKQNALKNDTALKLFYIEDHMYIRT